MLPPSSGLKYVGSEVGFVMYGNFKDIVMTSKERCE
jgi:hypothetical protein